jgi:hypothetical protein
MATQQQERQRSKRRPVHELRLGRIRAAVWENSTQNGTRYNVTVSRLYKDDDLHVGCIMLAREVLPFIGVFALLEDGCSEVWLTKANGLIGIERTDAAEDVQRFKRFHADDLVRRFAYAGTASDRNQHMMSGHVH